MDKVGRNAGSFDSWMAAVDRHLIRMIGVSSAHLPDEAYWDTWDDGCTDPLEMAMEVMESNGFAC